uniref:Uncharacterized protein n=1 Tax=Ananas comosus var. bracteatus TaxID=296719 RepID=A0A6V7QWR6_ANACO
MRRLHGGAPPAATVPAIPLPTSPLGFGCVPSPRTAYQMTTSTAIPLPSSPGVPSPRSSSCPHCFEFIEEITIYVKVGLPRPLTSDITLFLFVLLCVDTWGSRPNYPFIGWAYGGRGSGFMGLNFVSRYPLSHTTFTRMSVSPKVDFDSPTTA